MCSVDIVIRWRDVTVQMDISEEKMKFEGFTILTFAYDSMSLKKLLGQELSQDIKIIDW